jgi:hypothetical protein
MTSKKTNKSSKKGQEVPIQAVNEEESTTQMVEIPPAPDPTAQLTVLGHFPPGSPGRLLQTATMNFNKVNALYQTLIKLNGDGLIEYWRDEWTNYTESAKGNLLQLLDTDQLNTIAKLIGIPDQYIGAPLLAQVLARITMQDPNENALGMNQLNSTVIHQNGVQLSEFKESDHMGQQMAPVPNQMYTQQPGGLTQLPLLSGPLTRNSPGNVPTPPRTWTNR